MVQDNSQKAWAKIVAKAWTDPSFKKKLLDNPAQVCKENGITLKPNMTCKVVENTETVIHLVLPSKPSGEITEESLKQIAGGYCQATCAATACG